MKRFLIFLVALWGCDTSFFEVEGIDKAKWNPQVAVPIGYAEYSLKELLNEADSLVEVDEDQDNFITLIYSQQLFSESAQDFLKIVSQQFGRTFNLNIPTQYPDPIVLSNVNFTVEESMEFNYNPGENQNIDSINFHSGSLTIDVVSTIKAEIDAQLTFPNILINDQPLSIPLDLTNYGGASITKQVVETLQDFKLDLSNSNFSLDFFLDITTYGAPVSSTDEIIINLNLDNLSFKSFYGNVGTRTLNLQDERFTYDIFNEFDFGQIFFDDPRMVFTVDNSFGLPVAINLDGVYAEDPQDGRLDLIGSIVDNPPLIAAPNYSQIGQSVRSIFTVNKGNSNFNQIVSSLPTALNLPLNATTNPGGETENFVLDSSRIDILMTAELPLDLSIANLKNDMTFNFSSGEQLQDFDMALLKINIENGFPLEGKVKLTFKNDSINNLLTLTPNGDLNTPLFEGAPVDSEGIVTAPAKSVTYFELTAEQINLISKATEVNVEIEINTTNSSTGQTVKLLSTYKVKINLGIEAGMEVLI